MDITHEQYWKEVNSIAQDAVIEAYRDGLELEDYHDEVVEFLEHDVDGHPWIIYNGYGMDVLKHSATDTEYVIDEGLVDANELLKKQGLNGLLQVLAYFCMAEDVRQKANLLYEDYFNSKQTSEKQDD